MPLPKMRQDVAREHVGDVVSAMLTNPDVGDVSCEEQPDGRYRITPKPSARADD